MANRYEVWQVRSVVNRGMTVHLIEDMNCWVMTSRGSLDCPFILRIRTTCQQTIPLSGRPTSDTTLHYDVTLRRYIDNEKWLWVVVKDLVSISSIFYEQLLRQYSCTEKLQSQTASTKSFWCKSCTLNVGEIDPRSSFNGPRNNRRKTLYKGEV